MLSDFLLCHRVLLYAYNNKKAISCIHKFQEENNPHLDIKAFIYDLKNDVEIDKLEYEYDENINKILKNKEKFLKRDNFSIFSQNKVEVKAEVKIK